MSDTTEQLPPNACIDLPSDRDFQHSEIPFGAAPVERVKFPYDKFVIQNQGLDPLMYMSCTRQGITHINNAQNIIEAEAQNRSPIYTDPRVLWEERIAERPSVKVLGDSLQSAMNQMLAKKLIAGYAKVNSFEEAVEAIVRGAYIYTGSKDWDWKHVRDFHVYADRTDGWSDGHAFCAVDFQNDSKKALKGVNSYGQNNGFFDIPVEMLGSLYSMYAIYDARDELAVAAFLALKKQKQLELTAKSPYSELLIQLRESTWRLPLFWNYTDGQGITKELVEIGILRNILNK